MGHRTAAAITKLQGLDLSSDAIESFFSQAPYREPGDVDDDEPVRDDDNAPSLEQIAFREFPRRRGTS
jgi:hypothetical protein